MRNDLKQKNYYFIRTDGSETIGTGHLYRMNLLAMYLKNIGTVIFIVSKVTKEVSKVISQSEYQIFELNNDRTNTEPDNMLSIICNFNGMKFVIVDHYGIDYQWERKISGYVDKVIVWDDLANRKHYCDMLVDQTPGRTMSHYKDMVPAHTRCLLGQQFILLREEFEIYSKTSGEGSGPKHIAISFGGVDQHNLTFLVLNSLIKNPNILEISVIIGPGYSYKEQLMSFISESNLNIIINIYHHIQNIAEILSVADLAIGAGGTSALERAAMKLPSLIIITSDNQVFQAKQLSKKGVSKILNPSYLKTNKLNIDEIVVNLSSFLDHKFKFKEEFKIDFKGAERIIEEIFIGEVNEA